MEKNEKFIVEVEANTKPFEMAMQNLTEQSKAFGNAFTSSLQRSIVSGKSFDDTLKSIGMSLANTALKAGLKPLEGVVSNLFSSIFSSFGGGGGGASFFANGGVFNQQGIVPFAKGGIVNTPTLFSAGQSLGVMGEAGSEAILPLARGADGKLGVKSEGKSSLASQVIFNITTPDVESFYRSEAQVSAMLARTVGRGQRSL
jgi:lambda family phage tail tape measure protein